MTKDKPSYEVIKSLNTSNIYTSIYKTKGKSI